MILNVKFRSYILPGVWAPTKKQKETCYEILIRLAWDIQNFATLSTKGLCSKHRFCSYRFGSKQNFCCLVILLSAINTAHTLEFIYRNASNLHRRHSFHPSRLFYLSQITIIFTYGLILCHSSFRLIVREAKTKASRLCTMQGLNT